jgi:hypothetical protein
LQWEWENERWIIQLCTSSAQNKSAMEMRGG